MEPSFHKGDLVIVRQATDYSVGDIVVYRYPGIGNVFHRIISSQSGSYQMKGDNNFWTDSFSPEKKDIIGKFWFSIPALGKYLIFIKTPWVIAVFSGILCVMLGLSMIRKNEKKKEIFSRHLYSLANWRTPYWFLLYFVGIAALILGVVSFTHPLIRSDAASIPYQQEGKFSYTGEIAQNVYDSKEIQAGEPIYPALGCNIDLLFDYSFSSVQLFSGGGSYSLAAVLQANNGWTRSFELIPETQFVGEGFHVETPLNVCTLETIISDTESITGVNNLQYSLNLKPVVQITGKLGENNLQDVFSPVLTFVLDSQQLYLPQSTSSAEGGGGLLQLKTGSLEYSTLVTNSLSILGAQIPVKTGRIVAAIVLGLTLLGMIIPTLIDSFWGNNDRKLHAKMLMGPSLIETQSSPVSGNERIVDVNQLEEIISLSERFESVVFFYQQTLFTDYLVRDQSVVYRYRQTVPLLESSEQTHNQNEIYRAIRENEFALFYQPTYSINKHQITQVEALLRWNHPEKGQLTASQFLFGLEESDLICLIDNWVLQSACRQLREWKEISPLTFVLSINISAQQLHDPKLARNIQDAFLENQLKAGDLSIEISLDQLQFDSVVLNNLKEIRQLGINIAVKSGEEENIRKLYQLEAVDQLKLSPQLTRNLVSNTSQFDWARQMIAEAHKRNLGVTAVGVETSEEMGFLRINSFDGIQGNVISQPVPSKELLAKLSSPSNSLSDQPEN